MEKYEKIEQYRSALYHMRKAWQSGEHNHHLTFIGTVKLHGTNASVVLGGEDIVYQSRNRVLSVGDDNCGFALAMSENSTWFNQFHTSLKEQYGDEIFIVYGEWCGQGIQGGVAISSLSKMFVIFDVKIINENKNYYIENLQDIDFPEHSNIHSIYKASRYEVEVDCNNPDLAIEKLNEYTANVEDECPFGKLFDAAGIGEGIVWKSYTGNGYRYTFKTKGEKHSKSKVAKAPKVQLTPEQHATQESFITAVLNEGRMKQGLDYLREFNHEPTMSSFGIFIKWVISDVISEEADTMKENGFDKKSLGKILPNQIRSWYMNNMQ